MHIHKPKATHGLREFLSEIGVIVVGILIALSLESAIEWLHWRQEVSDGRERIREEIKFDERVYVHRDDVAPCVQENLTAMAAVISELRSRKHVGPIDEFVSPVDGPVRREVWNALSAGQVLVHFPKDELERYNRFYTNVQDGEYFMDRESRAWRQLHLLEGDPNQLSRGDINSLRIVHGEAQEMSQGVAAISRGQLNVARALGIELPKPDPSFRDECVPIGPR